MKSIIPIDAFPRLDLREKAFRKYERYIGRALNESYKVDTRVELGISPQTFILRFKDAICGFKRYRYESILFKQDADFDNIKLYQVSINDVSVVNVKQAYKEQNPADLVLSAATDMEKIKSLIEEIFFSRHTDPVYVKYSTEEERTAVEHCSNFEIDIRVLQPGLLLLRLY